MFSYVDCLSGPLRYGILTLWWKFKWRYLWNGSYDQL